MDWYSGVLGVEEPHQSIPNLVVKLYCGDNTVGEALRKNSSTPEWKKSLITPIIFQRSSSSKPHIDLLFSLLYILKCNTFFYKLYKENS